LTPRCTLCATIFQETLAATLATPAMAKILSSTIFLISAMTSFAG
jgi:hypothetical protein